jgi:hypothetical protein
MHEHISIYVCTYICINAHMNACMHIGSCAYMLFVCIMFVYMHACVYIFSPFTLFSPVVFL